MNEASMKSLSDYRWQKAHTRLQCRLSAANKIFDVFEDWGAMHRLKCKAMTDYINDVPFLRKLRDGAEEECQQDKQ